ncbi:MAG: DUF4430 domain-containing protein, partial [bacterium]|nr:DUF4430 domain-containing protein [bacterium]
MFKVNNLKLVGIILGILAIGAIYSVNVDNRIATEQPGQEKQPEQEEVVYVIDKGDENIKSYQIVLSEDSTVFSLLEELAGKENFQVESRIYEGMGVFVESIDGVKNGTENKYWQYWINGELPMVAADKKE